MPPPDYKYLVQWAANEMDYISEQLNNLFLKGRLHMEKDTHALSPETIAARFPPIAGNQFGIETPAPDISPPAAQEQAFASAVTAGFVPSCGGSMPISTKSKLDSFQT